MIKEKRLKKYLKGWGDKKKGDGKKKKLNLQNELADLENC